MMKTLKHSTRFWYSLALALYSSALTRSLLLQSPWSMFSRKLAENPPLDLSFEPYSWITHFFAYGVLLFLIQASTRKNSRPRYCLYFLAFVHGGVCEYLQGFIPGRWPSLGDMIANSLGLILGYIILNSKIPQLLLNEFQNHGFPLSRENTSPKKQAA
jgi:VanZ family protein